MEGPDQEKRINLPARDPMKPIIALLDNCTVDYKGRAIARQRGGELLVLIKVNGGISVHSLSRGLRPQFHNPPGRVSIRTSNNKLHIKSLSDTGEILKISGTPIFHHQVKVANSIDRPKRKRVNGNEADIVEWIQRDPTLIGLSSMESAREVRRTGGIVDVQFDDILVEVKKTASVRTYDQALRYLRGGNVSKVIIACLHSSKNLKELASKDNRVEVIELNKADFWREVSDNCEK
jgi:RecB family endonuclease NucS